MPRGVKEPCGTDAAYERHRRKGEETCEDCRRAHNERKARKGPKGRRPAIESQYVNYHTTAADKALAEREPKITWRKKPNGIWVHTAINDPHAETKAERQRQQLLAFEHRNLLTAARTDI